MKTIKQIADDLGVTKQAVFYRIKRPPLSNTLQSLMKKENGILIVSFDGETLIRQAFSIDAVKVFGDKEPSKENIVFDGTMTILQEQLKIKDEQIATLSRQLEAKDAQIAFLQQNATTAQHLHAGTIQKQLTDGRADQPDEDHKRGFISRLFGGTK